MIHYLFSPKNILNCSLSELNSQANMWCPLSSLSGSTPILATPFICLVHIFTIHCPHQLLHPKRHLYFSACNSPNLGSKFLFFISLLKYYFLWEVLSLCFQELSCLFSYMFIFHIELQDPQGQQTCLVHLCIPSNYPFPGIEHTLLK